MNIMFDDRQTVIFQTFTGRGHENNNQQPSGTLVESTKFAVPTPKPRLAKAFHRRHPLLPPYRFASAWIQASLAVGTRGGMTDELEDGYCKGNLEMADSASLAEGESKVMNKTNYDT